ncbi:hypothetical protein CDAR_448421 [Caerostris darwini]|uniref:Uncharacterized protein n=1 Tax=Caerostris darwini TaxID=1538125 RepID=A0AAV4QJU4_9ARAC|nr:hypothetical protein CDAR_448421 [Caerostris darwini]
MPQSIKQPKASVKLDSRMPGRIRRQQFTRKWMDPLIPPNGPHVTDKRDKELPPLKKNGGGMTVGVAKTPGQKLQKCFHGFDVMSFYAVLKGKKAKQEYENLFMAFGSSPKRRGVPLQY